MGLIRPFLFAAVLMTVLASRAFAQESELVDIHGFVSQGFLLSSENNYLAKSKHGSFEFTEAGLNFTRALTDDLRTGLQLFTRDLGPIGNYSVKLDWFYLDYRFRDWLGFRAGRVKIPFGLYNDVNDIDAAHVPVLMPQSVYSIQNRDFLLAQTGTEIYGRLPMARAGVLDYRAYGGTIFLDTTPQPGALYQVVSLDVPFVLGGRVLWELPIDGLRVGGTVQAIRLDTDLSYDPAQLARASGMKPSATSTGPASSLLRLDAILWVASVEYVMSDWLFAAEYSRWYVDSTSADKMLVPKAHSVSERLYGMLSYRVGRHFHPGVYYSLYFADVDVRKGRSAMTHDTALTLRFDINDYWLVKLEPHFISGTAALDPNLNGGKSRNELARDTWLVTAKTTAYF